MIIIDFINRHIVLIFIIILILFIVYQFYSWYNKGGKQRIEAIKKTFNTQKDKILSGESQTTSVNENISILKENLYK